MNTGLFFVNTTKLFRRSWWLSLFIWFLFIAPAQAALLLRVAIAEGTSQIRVGSSTNARVLDGAGRAIGSLSGNSGFVAKPQSGKVAIGNWLAGQIWIEPENNGLVWIGDRWYRGKTRIFPHKGGITVVNYVDLEQYLYSVLGSEMGGDWPLEALKAQAVAARSYALHQRETQGNVLYDLGNTQKWQVYKGVASESPGTYAAVNSTAGQVLTYDGQIILAVFHSSSGGHTENVEDVWSNPLPYLRGVPDFDQGTPNYEWTKTFSQSELSGKIGGVGNIMEIHPQKKSSHGSLISLKIIGDAGSKVMDVDQLTATLGLKSARFNIVSQKTQSQRLPVAFQIKGKGFGHGVGLSQWGAYNLARQGYNYQQILTHYYQGTNLARIDVRY